MIMNEIKYDIGDYVVYNGELNDWTYKVDIKPNDKGIITDVKSERNRKFYSVKFESGIIATIDSNCLEKVD